MAIKHQPSALPDRMSLAPDAFTNLDVAVLSFPFAKEVVMLCDDMKHVLRSSQPISPPYRQLNNAVLACAPTLTCGFEYVEFDRVRQVAHYRAVAVGTPEAPLRPPSAVQLHDLIKDWAQEWTQRFRGKVNGQADDVCDRFLASIAIIPEEWNWSPVDPNMFINDIYAEKGLGFAAVPSLLATLLHNKQCVIRGGHGDQQIVWRKAQGITSNRVGLFLVSKPFRAWYVDQYGEEKQGYFAYRLDFHVETQSGRLTSSSMLNPWVFPHLSCQRYAHEPLHKTNYGRDVSVLMGMHTPRIADCESDSTLVRLVIEYGRNGHESEWKYQLPEYLAAFKVRDLDKPDHILKEPTVFGNFENRPDWQKDEYYVVHAEGYKYSDEDGTTDHAIKTGYSLREYGDVIARVVDLLGAVLIPDQPLHCDIPAPSGVKTPLAMRDFAYMSAEPSISASQRANFDVEAIQKRLQVHRQKRQHVVTDALKRTLDGATMHVYIIWRERDTRDAAYRQLRESLFLSENDAFPHPITVSDVHIDDATLLAPLDTNGLAPKNGDTFNEQLRKQHIQKRQMWREFIQRALPQVEGKRFALVEIGRRKRTGIHPRQSVYGSVRDAFAQENIATQMLQTVTTTSTKQDDKETRTYSDKTKGRVQNAVLDLTLRQLGVLYGLPTELYERAGVPEAIATNLDVIAICRRRTSRLQGDVHFAIAVRMRATGAVDVLLPQSSEWIPYATAGCRVGQLFADARRDQFMANKRVNSKIKLSGAALAKFVAKVFNHVIEHPSLVVIEADGWRNERGEDGKIWPQLKNEHLYSKRDVLDLSHVGSGSYYERNAPQFNNLLGIVRLRTGKETPQYVTNRSRWCEDGQARDFIHLSGFCDETMPEFLHYFSIGRLPKTQRKVQDTITARDMYKLDRHVYGKGVRFDEYGANIPFKHQQMVEMVPFFVRHDFQSAEGRRMLCRVLHYLRCSPAWVMGNITRPYPMHLGDALIDDQLCILGVTD